MKNKIRTAAAATLKEFKNKKDARKAVIKCMFMKKTSING